MSWVMSTESVGMKSKMTYSKTRNWNQLYEFSIRWRDIQKCGTLAKQDYDHANLFGGSFKGLSRILDDSEEVIVRINVGLAKDWDVDKLAAQARFELVASAPFEQKDFAHP
ncbi:DUF2431 domain protein [Tanacetum coccineum]